jgi:geranylgeranyl pyrophosphate synthase
MHTFGYEIGMAFQIVDDVLDFTGEQQTVGKPVASDMRQGLFTLPALYYFEAHPEEADVKAVLRGNYSNDTVLNRLAASIRESSAIQQAIQEAGLYVERALDILAEMPESPQRQALEDLASYIIRRDF